MRADQMRNNSELWWNKARKINPQHQNLVGYDKIICNYYLLEGLKSGSKGNFIETISTMKKALPYDSLNTDVLYNLGGVYFTIHNTDSAKYFFQKTLRINPSHQQAIIGLKAVEMLQGK